MPALLNPVPAFPAFVKNVLPPGDYPLTLNQLRSSHLVTGEGNPSTTWDSAWRSQLVDNLEIMLMQLWTVGIEKIFINGSFVENKDHPHDIDGYFECDKVAFITGRIQRELNLLDPFKAWTWDVTARIPDRNSAKSQLPMWHLYHVELYPEFGQFANIKDEFGHHLKFPAAFRKTRAASRPKGIVQIVQ